LSENVTNAYDVDDHIAEIYDKTETYADDVDLIRRLIGGSDALRILEPFCGAGRILIPLAQDGHEMVGLDQAKSMLNRARMKIERLDEEVAKRITLIEADAVTEEWPKGFDLVILGANCFYELATPDEQEGCVASAAAALNARGYVYLDNNHMEGELDESWREPGVHESVSPVGLCDDGASVRATSETIWYDAPKRLWRCRRTVTVTLADGTVTVREWVQQKHPVSVVEQQTWLRRHGFVVEHLYRDRAGNPFTETSGRAIFWARKI